MTIFYIIGNIKGTNTGKGGSFHSSASVAKSMEKNHRVIFFVIGDFESPAIENIFGNDYIFLNTSTFGKKLKAIKSFVNSLRKYRPSIIHIFGNNVLFLSFIAQKIVKSRTVFTKCGKGNPKINSDYFSNVITLSFENYNFLQKFVGVDKPIKRLGYFPNRILPFEQDSNLIEKLKDKIEYSENDIIILRIGRLSPYYKTGILQSIEYFKERYRSNPFVKLVLLGHKDLDLSMHQNHKNLFIIDDFLFTKNPKSLFSIADVKIGNGRTAMEACYVGGEILIPTKLHGLVRLSQNNWQDILHYNMSERVKLSPAALDYNVYDSKFPKKIFKENFNVYSIVDKLANFYNNAYLDNITPKEWIIWGSIFFKKF